MAIMKHTAILIALSLCACAADRSAAPVSMTTPKDADAVASCIQSQWLLHGAGYPPVKAALDDGYTVQLLADGIGPMVIADVMPNGAGTTVLMRWWSPGDWNLQEPTRACL